MNKQPIVYGFALKRSIKNTKITFTVLLLFILQGIVGNVYAQEKKISISVKNEKLETVLRMVEKQTNYLFFYDSDEINKQQRITINQTNSSLKDVLDAVASKTNLSYTIKGRHIILAKKPNVSSTNKDGRASGSEKKITGIVKDEADLPVVGANVIVPRTKKGVITDMNGNFSLEVAAGDEVEISYLGYTTQKIKISAQNFLNVVLREDAKSLNEVVVVGYGSVKKSDLTGSVASVSNTTLLRGGKTNSAGALQGELSGVTITRSNNKPGGGYDIKIRGINSITASSSPLIVIDGVPGGNLDFVNPDDIEKIDVLKDASATAIYGSRAANGVIVIKTKAPSEGQLRVNYNFTASIAIPDLNGYDLLDAREKLDFEKSIGMYKDNNADAQINKDKDYNYKLSLVESGVNTYWLSQPLKVEFNQKHSIFIEGGDKAVRYGIDFKYDKDNGVMKGSARDRGALGFSLSYNLKDKLLVRNYLTVNKVKSKESPYGDFSQYALLNPYYPFQDEHGNLIRKMTQYINTNKQIWNPVYEATVGNRDESEYLDVTNNFSLEWSIVQGLRLRANFSYGEKKEQVETFVSPESLQYESYELSSGEGLLNKGEGYHGTSNTYSMDFNSVLTYYLGVGKHFINTALGVNLTESGSRSVNFDVRGYPSKMMDYISLAKEFTNTHPGGSEGKTRLAGFFANVNYSYANRYLLDLSARLDGSSMYGSESKFSPFWAVGLGWNIHHEKFMENTGISRLKIRGSIGTTGKASFQPYQSQTMFEYIQDGWYATGIGATLMALGNPNLKWETTTAYDLGLDFGMWEDRLTVTFGYYLKKTKNLLSSVTLPTSLGFIDYKENLGQMENEGVELALRSFVYKSNDWNVSLFVNMAHNKNRIVSISNALSSYNDKADQEQANNDDYKTKPMVRYKEGRSSTAIYAMKSLGIDPATGKELFQRQDGTNTYVWDPKESVVCGDTEPKVTGAFGTNITWKQLNLNMNFSYRLGGQVYNQTLINRVENADPRDNVDRRVLEQRWQKPGDHTFYKDINDKSTTPASSRFIQDENVLQLGSLSLSYDLKKEWLKPIGFDMVRLTAMMNDVFRLSTVKRERGISYPFARSMSLGVMVQF